MVNKCLIFLLAIVVLISCGCSSAGVKPGVVHGKVNIGPISPVEKIGETTSIPCEVYEARKIMIYDKKAKKLVQQIDIDCEGIYEAELKPGIYTVDINRIGIDSSSDVPKRIEIESGMAVKLDIDIDTGIR